MALTEAPHDSETLITEAVAPTTVRPPASAVERVLSTADHVTIGRMFVGFSLGFGVIGLVVSALLNFDTAAFDSATRSGLFSAAAAARLAANEGTGLLLCCALPLLLGLAVLIVPRQIGAPVLSFGRAAALSMWTWLLASIVFLVSVAADGSYGGTNIKLARLGNVAVGTLMVALLIGGVCVAVTVFTQRPAGMGLSDVPFFSFSMVVSVSIWVLSLPAVLAHVVLAHIVQPSAADLAKAFNDGISWYLRQPSIYVAVIPVLGLAADVAATAVGGRHRFRGSLHVAIGAAGALSFGAWVQTPIAQDTAVWVVMCIAFGLPVLIVLGAVADTLRGGDTQLIAPLGFAVSALLLALLGSLVGVLAAIDTAGKDKLMGLGADALNRGLLYLILGAAITGAVGGCFYWARQGFGGSLPDGVGRALVPLSLLAVSLWGLPHLILGVAQAKSPTADASVLAGISGFGALLVGLVVLVTLASGLRVRSEAGRGDALVADPWGGAGTLEWAEAGSDPAVVDSPYPLLDAKGGE